MAFPLTYLMHDISNRHSRKCRCTERWTNCLFSIVEKFSILTRSILAKKKITDLMRQNSCLLSHWQQIERKKKGEHSLSFFLLFSFFCHLLALVCHPHFFCHQMRKTSGCSTTHHLWQANLYIDIEHE
jgi:hypothetical protein